MIIRFITLVFFLAVSSPSLAKGTLADFRAIRADAGLQSELKEIVATGLRQAFGETVAPPKNLDSRFQKPGAVFVTLKKGPEVRGCMGTLFARESALAQEINGNLRKALFFDPWHRPVTREEIAEIEVYLTATGGRTPVRGIAEISPAQDGVLIRQGAKEAVVLPGEAKTQRYLLAFLKSKAGIKKGPYQLFRVKTETIAVKPFS